MNHGTKGPSLSVHPTHEAHASVGIFQMLGMGLLVATILAVIAVVAMLLLMDPIGMPYDRTVRID